MVAMLKLDADPTVADKQMRAVIFYLTTFGHIDGRLQAQRFLQRIGCHTMVRGHEKVVEGFRRTYDDDNLLLVTLFSAGGKNDHDLPPRSSYRLVTPMALTLSYEDGKSQITPLAHRVRDLQRSRAKRVFPRGRLAVSPQRAQRTQRSEGKKGFGPDRTSPSFYPNPALWPLCSL